MIQLPTIWPVTRHTDHVGKNSIFVAIKGQKEDGVAYIPLALKKGAKKIVAAYDADIPPEICALIKEAEAELIFVENPRRTLALYSAQAWFYPAQQLKIIGITGTKGKTTTAWLLYHLFQSSGKKTALLSTVINKIDTQNFDTQLTTQHPDYLHAFFHTCVTNGIEFVVMEVAAQAVSLQRVAGLEFHGLVFTNFAPTHGEFYHNEDDYFNAKKALFTQIKKEGICLINADDPKANFLIQDYPQARVFSFNKSDRDYGARIIDASLNGITLTIQDKENELQISCSGLIGNYNAYNLAAAVGMGLEYEIAPAVIASALTSFAGVPGRLEKYQLPNESLCFIDYAHNPLSFQSLLSLLRTLTEHLIVVTGAGGNRDALMRPVLGKLASDFADLIILTTDNPRQEDPALIINQIMEGINEQKKASTICQLDRAKAIEVAYQSSKKGSIIALLGKGPEQYQIIGYEKIPFSERSIIQSLR